MGVRVCVGGCAHACPILSLSLSLSLTHTHTRARTHTHTQDLPQDPQYRTLQPDRRGELGIPAIHLDFIQAIPIVTRRCDAPPDTAWTLPVERPSQVRHQHELPFWYPYNQAVLGNMNIHINNPAAQGASTL